MRIKAEQKYKYRLDFEKSLKLQEEEKVKREPELLRKLEEIMDRVKSSRNEQPIDNIEVWSMTNVTSKIDTPDFICKLCGNKV